MIHIQFLIVFNCFFFLRIFPSFFFFLRKINSHSTFYIFFRTIVLRMVKILYLFTILRKIARFIRISYIGKWMYVIMMRRKIIYGLIYTYNKKNITEWIWLRRFGRSVCWRCRCRWCWLVEWNAATAPIGRRAEVRSIAWLEPPVPGRASYGKLLRLCIVREAPKLQTACLRYFSPSVSSRFFPSCVGLLFVNTVIDSSLWFCFSTPPYIGFINRRTRVKFATPLFFSGSQVNDVNSTNLPTAAGCRYVLLLWLNSFVFRELSFYPVPFSLLFKDFSSTFCEIDSGDCLFSIKLVPGKCFFLFFFFNLFPIAISFFLFTFSTFLIYILYRVPRIYRVFIRDDERLFIAYNGTNKVKIFINFAIAIRSRTTDWCLRFRNPIM